MHRNFHVRLPKNYQQKEIVSIYIPSRTIQVQTGLGQIKKMSKWVAHLCKCVGVVMHLKKIKKKILNAVQMCENVCKCKKGIRETMADSWSQATINLINNKLCKIE